MFWDSNCYSNVGAIKLPWQVDAVFMGRYSNRYGNVAETRLLPWQADAGFIIKNSNCCIALLSWQVDSGLMVWDSNCYDTVKAIKLLWQVDTGFMAKNSNCYDNVLLLRQCSCHG